MSHAKVAMIAAVVLGVCLVAPTQAQDPTSTAVTYQGQLKQYGEPVTGTADFLVGVYDVETGGTAQDTFMLPSVSINDGLFTLDLDFDPSVYNGDGLWLEIQVAVPPGAPYVTLTPRQPIRPTPYALYALAGPGGGGSQWVDHAEGVYYDAGNVGIGGTPSAQQTLRITSGNGEYALFVTSPSTAAGQTIVAETAVPGGYAVVGQSNVGSGETYGVYGYSESPEGFGLYGDNQASTGNAIGVYGHSNSLDGFGGYFLGRGYFSGNLGIGTTAPIYPLHVLSTARYCIYGETDASTGRGVQGIATHPTAAVSGVVGTTSSTAGRGVLGSATATSGVASGVRGEASSLNGYGVWGHNDADAGVVQAVGVYGSTASSRGVGVKGYAPGPDGGYGVWGFSDGSSGRGVVGTANAVTGGAIGVEGDSSSPTGIGVYAYNDAESGSAIAVRGDTGSPDGFGGYFTGKGYFSGYVGIGTTSPSSPLTVSGLIESTSGGVKFPDGTVQTTAGGGGGGVWHVNGSDIYYDGGNVGINYDSPIYALHVWAGADAAIAGENPAEHTRGELGSPYGGVFGESESPTGTGVFGQAIDEAGSNYGVRGEAYGLTGRGVFGLGASNTGSNYGVYGQSQSATGRGVCGENTESTGTTYGVFAQAYSGDGFALYAKNEGDFGSGYGVYAESWAPDGVGVRGHVTVDSGDGNSVGVWGEVDSSLGKGVYGKAQTTGVEGYATATSGTAYGVHGVTDASGAHGRGVFGVSNGNYGRGVMGEVTGTNGFGVYGQATSGTGVYGETNSGAGVYGFASAQSGTTYGVRGVVDSPGGRGVYGVSDADSGRGVMGEVNAAAGYGVFGLATTGTGVYGEAVDGTGVSGFSENPAKAGVYGSNDSETGNSIGVWGRTGSSVGFGGYFEGQGYFSDHLGIGTTSPEAPLDILGGNWDVANTDGDVRIGTEDHRLKIGVATGGVGAGTCRIFAQGGTNRLTLGSDTTDVMTVVDTAIGGCVGVGVTSPDEKLHVDGRVKIENSVVGDALFINTPGDGIYVDAGGEAFNCYGVTTGVHGYSNNGIGVYAEGDGTTTAHPALLVENTNSGGIAVFFTCTSSDANTVIANKGAGDLIKGFSGATGNDLVFKVTNDGTTHTNVLQINGGSDVAERFDVSETAEAGTVVAIDPDHPGKLCVARGAYNRCVAGVISGANGVGTGMVLADLPGTENSLPVALSGRVWVRCDATSRPIEPGDLLTTAERAGHAMGVGDFDRAHGAVIGKAMTRLAQGETGMVLALVNLQ